MSNEIVRRLMKNHRVVEFLNEDVNLYEADDEEDEEERVIEPIEDDSTAPEQGNPEDYEYEEGVSEEDIDYDEDDFPGEEGSSSEEDIGDEPPSFRGSSTPPGMSSGEGGSPPEEGGKANIEDSPNDTPNNQYVNPLDNDYAVNYTLGDEVVLSYANGTDSDLKGHIDGYDKEGFYRVKWDSGLTTNGITDIALSDLVSSKKESTCICGGTNLITEGKYIICDDCGRRIRESMKMDHLTQLDKQRPKGKKLVRSEAHPMTTATRPNIDIAESIKKALKGK